MANKAKKIPHIKPINNFAMLFVLSIFQLITGFEAASVHEDFSTKAILSSLNAHKAVNSISSVKV